MVALCNIETIDFSCSIVRNSIQTDFFSGDYMQCCSGMGCSVGARSVLDTAFNN
jgi:hypothetical protein